MPQLRLVILSTARPLIPSFLHVFVRRAEPAQISITSNSSMATPANLWWCPCGPLQVFEKQKFELGGSILSHGFGLGSGVFTTSATLEKGPLLPCEPSSHDGFDLQAVTLCPGLWQ